MAKDAVVLGQVRLPQRHLETWLSTPVRPRDFTGWPDAFEGDFEAKAPEVIIQELSEQNVRAPEFLDVRVDGNELKARMSVSLDTFVETRLELATLFRSAGRFGGGGRLVFAGMNSVAFGYLVHVGWGHSTVRTLSEAEIRAVEKTTLYREVDRRTQAALDVLLGRAEKKPDVTPRPGRGRWSVNPFTGKRIWTAG